MAYEVKYCCDECDHVFYKMVDRDPRKINVRAPACPECRKNKAKAKSQIKVSGDVKSQTETQKDAVIEDIIASKKFPSSGKGAFTKAMDETAKIVMEDYQMTNLNDNLREGDNMVPKLRPELEAQVGKGFNANQKNNVAGLAGANLNKALTAQINTNRFASQGDVVSKAMSVVQPPITNIIGHYQPEKPS